jgi:hypothetical protein
VAAVLECLVEGEVDDVLVADWGSSPGCRDRVLLGVGVRRRPPVVRKDWFGGLCRLEWAEAGRGFKT